MRIMALSLRTDHKQYLLTITNITTPALKEYCTQALEYVEDRNIKDINDVADLHSTAKAIFNLLLETSKQNFCTAEFGECLVVLGFNEEQISILQKLYETCNTTLKCILSSFGPSFEQYIDLHWRFEAQIKSRYLRKQSIPAITMKLFLMQDNNKKIISPSFDLNTKGTSYINQKEILLQTDINTLLKIINVLEKALQEGKSQRVRSIIHALE